MFVKVKGYLFKHRVKGNLLQALYFVVAHCDSCMRGSIQPCSLKTLPVNNGKKKKRKK